VIVRYIGWTDTLVDEIDLSDHAIGRGFSASSVIRIGKTGNLSLQATFGEGIENDINDALVDVGIQDNPGDTFPPIVGVALPIFGMVAYYDWGLKAWFQAPRIPCRLSDAAPSSGDVASPRKT
jgi:hypothetical protein